MDFSNTLGLLAGAMTTAAFVPQVIKIWKSRNTRDISLGMFVIFSGGLLLWLFYGIQIGSTPIVIANAITLGLALTILVFKIKFK